ncbi:uncharacterized protein LOC123265799 [Cotesia glomerata]|uniref:uncharacterized protein LOC123265799 n=1 Tax=Cotesia glomerata TaxID=32391 RepID=UPI001D00F589|nr:uncharacterized protein LOC123265799 [Cotesia glomerata]
MHWAILFFFLELITSGFCLESDVEDYGDSKASSSSIQTDAPDDYDSYEINELEDATRKTYHCAARNSIRNETNLDRRVIEVLDDNGIPSLQAKRLHYQVRSVRQKMCQSGFNPFQLDKKGGSVHRRFKNTIRLMIYNTPGMFPGLRLIRSDLDRKRKREPQNWFRFELTNSQIIADFDYDNYFVTIYGDFGKIHAYSKLLVTLKMHKRLNNFNDSISSKINLDLGIMEVILSNFGTTIIKDKSLTSVMVKALNGIRTELSSDGDIQIEFEDSAKEALDQINPLLYSVVWLQSMAEKYEVVKVRDKSKSPAEKMKKSN